MYEKLHLVKPDWDDPLTRQIMELDHLKKRLLYGSTPPYLFFQLKTIFHMLESLGSARIEGNRTTLAELVDDAPPVNEEETEELKEIRNVEKAMRYIEEVVKPGSGPEAFSHVFIRTLHELVTKGLRVDKEGDPSPGAYRSVNVVISGAKHRPPEFSAVHGYMDELLSFLAHEDGTQYDLIKVALAHHRFVWIHPFRNGNGRTVRLFTYALLIRFGFDVGRIDETKLANESGISSARILNPTAVFCADRDAYYRKLADADSGTDIALLEWCSYVLTGLNAEIEKIDRLLDYSYLKTKILLPAITGLRQRNHISQHESIILSKTIDSVYFAKKNVKSEIKAIKDVQLSRIISSLRDRGLLIPVTENARKYVIGFRKGPMLREVIRQLDQEGFLPIKNEI
ncbi:MAG: Fic family protein [bacterium]